MVVLVLLGQGIYSACIAWSRNILYIPVYSYSRNDGQGKTEGVLARFRCLQSRLAGNGEFRDSIVNDINNGEKGFLSLSPWTWL